MDANTRPMSHDLGLLNIRLNGQWDLEDLSWFPKNYNQLYSFFYFLEMFEQTHPLAKEYVTTQGLKAHFLDGRGYSSINYYNYLSSLVPYNYKPFIKSIDYHSPGWLKIVALVYITSNIHMITKNVCLSIREVNQTYSEIRKGMQERELTDEKIRIMRMKNHSLNEHDQKYLDDSASNLCKVLGYPIDKKLDGKVIDSYAKMKMILSVTERFKVIREFEVEKKISVNESLVENVPKEKQDDLSKRK